MTQPSSVVFLVDVDDTLLENDRIQDDLRRYLEREFGPECRERFWAINEDLFQQLGYRDYLGTLQKYRAEHAADIDLLQMSSFLIDYAFANRLYPRALYVLKRFHSWGPTVILSDGDVVFQPRKVERSGIHDAVDGNVLIYIHKEDELDDVERRYPAAHYVLEDDKLRILAGIKKAWGIRLTAVFPRRGKFASDPTLLAAYPNAADVNVACIDDLLISTLSTCSWLTLKSQNKDDEHESHPVTPQPRTEPLARQHHARPTRQRYVATLHQ